MLIAYFVRSNGFILSEMHGSEANFSNLTKNTKKLSLFSRIQDSSKSVVRLGNSSNTKKLMMECSAGVWTLHRTLQPGVARPLGKDPRQFWLTRVQDTRCWGFRKGSTNTFHTTITYTRFWTWIIPRLLFLYSFSSSFSRPDPSFHSSDAALGRWTAQETLWSWSGFYTPLVVPHPKKFTAHMDKIKSDSFEKKRA